MGRTGRIASALCLIALLLLAGAGSGQAANGDVIGCIKLRPTKQEPFSRGNAQLDVFPRHAEIYARFVGPPRRDAYMVWLLPRPGVHSEAFLGGAAPGDEGGFSGAFIVPGGHPVGERNVRAAEKVVLTSMPLRQARRISKRYQVDHYRKPHPIRGAVFAKGGVQPVRDTVCPH